MNRRLLYLAILTISPILVYLVHWQISQDKAIITLDPQTTYQTMMGWEAVAQAGQIDCPGFDTYKDALFDAAVNDLGINRLRVSIRATGSNSLKFNFASFEQRVRNVVVPMRQLAQARNEELFINVIFVGKSGFPSEPDMSAYADQVLSVYKHLESQYGFLPDSWEIVLEPTFVSPGWGASQINDAIIRTDEILTENGFSNPHLIAPSSPCGPETALNMFKDMLSVNDGLVPAGLDEFAYHRYCMATDRQLQDIAQLRTTYGLNTAMLEHGGGNYEELHADLKIANVSAWEQFALAYCTDDDGYQYYPIQGDTFIVGERTKYLRQYFKYIRIGAVRIQAKSDSTDFDPVAFINKDGSYVVVVKASIGGDFEISGLPNGSYGVKYTTDRQYDVDLLKVVVENAQGIQTAIPEKGVITIYSLAAENRSDDSLVPPVSNNQPKASPASGKACWLVSFYACRKK